MLLEWWVSLNTSLFWMKVALTSLNVFVCIPEPKTCSEEYTQCLQYNFQFLLQHYCVNAIWPRWLFIFILCRVYHYVSQLIWRAQICGYWSREEHPSPVFVYSPVLVFIMHISTYMRKDLDSSHLPSWWCFRTVVREIHRSNYNLVRSPPPLSSLCHYHKIHTAAF